MDSEDQFAPRQPALFELVDDSAVLFTPDQLAKRYTAGQVKEISRVRSAIIMLVSAGWPKEDIARQLHMNTRTVEAVAASASAEVAGTKHRFVGVLRGYAARCLALMRMKEGDATFAQLAVGLGIAMDKARDLEMMGLVGEEIVLKAEADRGLALAELRQLAARALGQGSTSDLVSSGESLISNDLEKQGPVCGGNDAGAAAGPGDPEGGRGDRGGGAGGPASTDLANGSADPEISR